MQQIPGYYWDEEKKRFFKIEKSQTAQATSAWSLDNVKRRKVQDQKDKCARRRSKMSRDRIKRSRALNEPLMGGFLAREFGSVGADVASSIFANDLVKTSKVRVSMPTSAAMPLHIRRTTVFPKGDIVSLSADIPSFDQAGSFTYVHDSGLHFLQEAICDPKSGDAPSNGSSECISVPQQSDMKYHAPTDRMLLSSSTPDYKIDLWGLSLSQVMQEDYPVFDQQSCTSHSLPHGGLNHANVIAAGPSNGPSLCVIGCHKGLQRSQGDHLQCITLGHLPPHSPFRDIFAADYRHQYPETVLFGGRPSTLVLGDMRVHFPNWSLMRFPSVITHVKSLDEHQVLVSGLKNRMDIYDLRMAKPRDAAKEDKLSKAATPVVSFAGYQNSEHINIGLDVSKETGLVAAAHGDGEVALYSIKTGNRLRSHQIDKIQSTKGPVETMQFQTMSWDVNPSLYLSVGSNIHAYTLSRPDLTEDD